MMRMITPPRLTAHTRSTLNFGTIRQTKPSMASLRHKEVSQARIWKILIYPYWSCTRIFKLQATDVEFLVTIPVRHFQPISSHEDSANKHGHFTRKLYHSQTPAALTDKHYAINTIQSTFWHSFSFFHYVLTGKFPSFFKCFALRTHTFQPLA